MKQAKRMVHLFLCICLLMSLWAQPVYAAPDWPNQVGISAEGGIVIDADSGAVLYGQNIHQDYFPASITKILTALIVIEQCDMDDIVTFSHNAVYNVEQGSTSAGMDVGDQLTVRQCLYALVLRSANEVANALAEHTAGSMEAFAAMMNAKAVSLGCTDSNFANPSGLNDPNHYTSAYDMALIAQAAFENEEFVEIDSTTYYDLPPTKRNVDGLRVYPGHRMLRRNAAQYYPGIIGGKTGYTSLAGNTLVTCAERDGMRLITVILNGAQTHYEDTKALLDFGFSNFKTVPIADFDTTYASVENDMTIAGLPTTDLSLVGIEKDKKITLPVTADFTDAESSISYDLPVGAPEGAVAQISYTYNDRVIGSAYLMVNQSSPEETLPMADILPEVRSLQTGDTELEPESVPAGSEPEIEESQSGTSPFPAIEIPPVVWKVLIAVAVLAVSAAGLIFLKIRIEKREEAERMLRYERRQQRLRDIGISTTEFDMLMQQRSTAGSSPAPKRKAGYKGKKRKSFRDKK